MKRKLTPKQRVLKRHPCSELDRDTSRDLGEAGIEFHDFSIWNSHWFLGSGASPKEAWADAARREHGQG